MNEKDKQMLADHYLDFYRMAFVVLKNETEVEDAVQEALAITMSKVFVSDPYNYCVSVLHNYCYKRMRSNTYVLLKKLPELASDQAESDEMEATMKQLWEFKDQLPPPLGQIMDLYFVEGLTKTEIAEEKGLSLAAVKRLFRRGFKQLQKQMQELEEEVDKNKNT